MGRSWEKARVSSGNAPTIGGERLGADGPVLEGELAHREVFRVAGREPAAERECRRCYEAVCLSKCAAATGELAAPLPGLPAFHSTSGHDSKAINERASLRVLARTEPPNRFLHVDRA